MRTRLPPNVTRERNRHGTPVFYYRVGKGPRTRLPDYGSPDFDEAYQSALRGEPVGQPRTKGKAGTLRWLITEYKKSTHWRNDIGEETRITRDRIFKEMVDKSGDVQIRRINEKTIIDARERRSTTGRGHAANAFLKAIKPVFAYAKMRGWIDIDPAKSVPLIRIKIIGHKPWGVADVQKYEKRHPVGTMANLAMRILLFAGFRRSDAVLFGPRHIINGVVVFQPGKTEDSSEAIATFTALPPLVEAIEATATGKETFLVTEWGEPFASGNSFGNWFRDRCEEAGVKFRAHGLRKTGPILAAQAGASAKELMAMWGWTTIEQAELYTRLADNELLGSSAASKLLVGLEKANTPRT